MNSYFRNCSNSIFWIKESLMHPAVNSAWWVVNAVESMKRMDFLNLQDDKLSRLLYFAAIHVPFYREWFNGRKDIFKQLSIHDFPVLEKKDIRGREELFIADGYAKRIKWTRTSGSTGEPFRFARSEYDYAYATLWRGLIRWGIRPGDKRVLVKGVDETAAVTKWTRIKRSIYGWINRCIVVDAHFLAKSDSNIEYELRRIIAYKPFYLHGYVSSLYLLARYAEEHGIDCSALKLKAIVTESEKCHDFQRDIMERVFHAPVVENYGSVEFGMVAQPAEDGILTINEDHVYLETTESGEVVITNLDEYGFPLIRFKNGDKVILGGGHNHLPFRTILRIEGRVAETIHLPQGGSLQGYIVMYPISKHMKYLREYQVYQPDINNLLIRVVEAEPLPAAIEAQIVSEMRDIVGDVINVEIQKVKSIPLTKRGKRAFVCSDVR